MEYRALGRTGLDISLIGLGTMTWGVQNNQQQGFEQMDYALAQGINFFDTAEMYAIPPSEKTFGTTETIIGIGLLLARLVTKSFWHQKLPGQVWIG